MVDRSSVDMYLSRVLVGVPPYHNHYVVGGTGSVSTGCNSIYVTADGNGPMGHYDRVHVEYENGRHLIFPAHMCTEMEVKND